MIPKPKHFQKIGRIRYIFTMNPDKCYSVLDLTNKFNISKDKNVIGNIVYKLYREGFLEKRRHYSIVLYYLKVRSNGY